MNTIYAIRQVLAAFADETEYREARIKLALSACRTALARHADKSADPLAEDNFLLRGELASALSCWHRLTGKESDELVSFFASHPTPLPSGERAALIERLIRKAEFWDRLHPTAKRPNNYREAADMLAADAQELEHTRKMYEKAVQGRSDFRQALREARSAQQVAVPQGWKPDPIGEVFAHQPMGCFLVRPIGSEATTLALGDKLYLTAAPQPPQAERVAMTDVEIDDEWNNTINVVGLCHRTLARAIETHHGIGAVLAERGKT